MWVVTSLWVPVLPYPCRSLTAACPGQPLVGDSRSEVPGTVRQPTSDTRQAFPRWEATRTSLDRLRRIPVTDISLIRSVSSSFRR